MNLRTQVLTGVFWVGGLRVLSQIVTWAVTIVVIRLLSPSDYGLVAMATVFMSFLNLAAEAGLGPALVTARELNDVVLRRAFGIAILMNLALFLLQYTTAPLISGFFDEDRLLLIIRVMALQFLMAAFMVVPDSLLQRQLNFKYRSLIELAAALVASLLTLGMAISGYGVWSLVAGALAGRALSAAALNVVCPFMKWPDFSFAGMRSLLVVGGQISAARALYFVYSQFDKFIVGKLLGKEMLGLYSTSLHLASLPVQRIASIVNQVAFPAFSEARREPEAIPRHLLKVIRVLSFFSFPVLWGISSIAPEIVGVLLGPKWEPAKVPLQLLPLVMPLTMISPFLNTAFQGLGQTGVVLKNASTMATIMSIAFLTGTLGGLVGLSFAWLIGFPLAFWLNLRRMMPLVGLKPSDVFSAMALPAGASVGMYGCVMLTRYAGRASLAPLELMVGLVVIGATSYVALTLSINRIGVREIGDLFRIKGIKAAR